MPIICRFFGIVIRMFFNEHAPPHFHAEYGEHRAEIDIATLEVLAGRLPRRALEQDWAELHRNGRPWFCAKPWRPSWGVVLQTAQPGFAEECRRQSRLLRDDPHERETLEWLGAATDTEGWE